jgi:ribonuclease III
MDMVQRSARQPDWWRLLILDALTVWFGDVVGERPKKIELVRRALTHGSTGKPDYQRLEFLGDRVLGLTIAEMLYQQFPDESEGRLSHRLNALVSGESCAEIARDIGLQDHMVLGKQARDDGARESDNVLGDMIEALIGAIFIDMGPAKARAFVERYWRPMLESALEAPKHPKSQLQEWCAAHNHKVPEYQITGKEGPPHAMRFEITVTVKGFDPISAQSNSRQSAEKAAAKEFLERHA